MESETRGEDGNSEDFALGLAVGSLFTLNIRMKQEASLLNALSRIFISKIHLFRKDKVIMMCSLMLYPCVRVVFPKQKGYSRLAENTKTQHFN